MTFQKKFFISLLVLTALSGPALVSAQADAQQTTSNVRADTEYVFRMPAEKEEEILDYLQKKYINDPAFLKQYFPQLQLRPGGANIEDDQFTDQYFDTNRLDLYKRKSSVRHRLRVDLQNNQDPKNNRELVQIRVTNGSDLLVRPEIKFKVARATQPNDEDDFHPLIGLIKLKDRAQLKQIVSDGLGIDPHDLRPFLNIIQHRRRLYINGPERNLISFSVDDVTSRIWWSKTRFAILDLGIDEISYTQADEKTKAQLRDLRENITKDLQAHFPYVALDLTPKYNRVIDDITPHIPWFNFLARIGLL